MSEPNEKPNEIAVDEIREFFKNLLIVIAQQDRRLRVLEECYAKHAELLVQLGEIVAGHQLLWEKMASLSETAALHGEN